MENRVYEQKKAYSVLKNDHISYIRAALAATVQDERNLESLWPYVRRIGNPFPKIISFLSNVHARRPVVTLGDDSLDSDLWDACDVRAVFLALLSAEKICNATGDAFAWIFRGSDGKITARAIPPHEVVAADWAEDGELRSIVVEAVAGRVRLEAPEIPIVHYRMDESADDWCIDRVAPLVELSLEVGVQMALFLETSYLRSHEQLSMDQIPPEFSPGDLGEIPVGTRKVLPFPLRSIRLIDPETASRFFQGLVDLTVFAAEQAGIPKGYFLQTDKDYPPALRDRWEGECLKFSRRDEQVFKKICGLASKIGAFPEVDPRITIQYQEPRGMVAKKDELEAIEKEIALGINNPVWQAFASDGDFRTMGEAREWITQNLTEWARIVEIKAERNIAVEGSDLTPQQNGTLAADYDGAAGPRKLPPESFAK